MPISASTDQPVSDRKLTAIERLAIQLSEPASRRWMMNLVLVNLFILMCRPQNNLVLLGKTKIAVLLGLIPLIVVIPRLNVLWRESRILKALLLLLVLGAIWVFSR